MQAVTAVNGLHEAGEAVQEQYAFRVDEGVAIVGHAPVPEPVVYVLQAGAQTLLLPAKQGPAGPAVGQLAMLAAPLKLAQVETALPETIAEVHAPPDNTQYAN